MNINALTISVALCLLSLVSHAEGQKGKQPTRGAAVFYEQCALCHGNTGLGDGALPLILKQYPETRLKITVKGNKITEEELRVAIVKGGSNGDMSEYMPPMGEELSAEEIDDLIAFLLLIQSDAKKATQLVNDLSPPATPSIRRGKRLYRAMCTLCHGETAEGDGRMARIIKNPPPANLRASTSPSIYIEKIIELGGEKMGRSPQMPPWGDQLNKADLASLVLYLESIKQTSN